MSHDYTNSAKGRDLPANQKLFGIDANDLRQRDSLATAQEILQQPRIWNLANDAIERRREEIARMLAGRTVTDEARAAADRLLAGALERAAEEIS